MSDSRQPTRCEVNATDAGNFPALIRRQTVVRERPVRSLTSGHRRILSGKASLLGSGDARLFFFFARLQGTQGGDFRTLRPPSLLFTLPGGEGLFQSFRVDRRQANLLMYVVYEA